MKVALMLVPAVAFAGPVAKVVEMLKDLQTRGQEELQRETVICKEYTVWSAGEISRTQADLINAKRAVEKEDSREKKALASADELRANAKISNQQKQTALTSSEQITKVFDKSSKELEERIAALSGEMNSAEQALETLGAVLNNLSASVFVQIEDLVKAAPVVGTGALFNYIRGFAPAGNQNPHKMSLVAPASYAYTASEGGQQVLKLVENLVTDLRSTLQAAQVELSSTKQAHQLKINSLNHEAASAARKLEKQSRAASKHEELYSEASQAKAHFESTASDLEKSLRELKNNAASKSKICADNETMRSAELNALAQAITTISSNVEHSYSARRGGASMMQIGHASNAIRGHIVTDLQQKAVHLKSSALASVAELAASSGPFDSVIDMMSNLLEKLQEEHSQEQSDKQECDKEMQDNEARLENLNSEVSQFESTSSRLQQEFSGHTQRKEQFIQEITNRENAQASANKLRDESKKANQDTIATSTQCVRGTQDALQILWSVYPPSSSASLTQVSSRQSPGADIMEYSGMQNESQGPLAILKTILQDCTDEYQEARSQEEQESVEHENYTAETIKFLAEHNKSKHFHDREAQVKQHERGLTDQKLKKSEELLVQENERAVLLKQQCIQTGLSFEERTKAREEEIATLRGVLTVLDRV